MSAKYPKEDWQYEVQNGDTKLGYAEWVAHRKEADLGPRGKPGARSWLSKVKVSKDPNNKWDHIKSKIKS